MQRIIKMETVMGCMLLAAALLLATGGVKQAASTQVKKAERTIVIDAGHGGDDPGKIGIGGALEKDINLEISKKLQKCLEKEGIRVVMTRKDGDSLAEPGAANQKQSDMRKRCDIIEKEDPVFTVSIHQNSYPQESVHGPQVFYYTQSEPGRLLAGCIQDALNTDLQVDRPREIKANNTYYLLKRSKSPTVIVECGFLSNRAEEAKLATEEYQDRVAQAVYRGIMECLKDCPFPGEVL